MTRSLFVLAAVTALFVGCNETTQPTPQQATFTGCGHRGGADITCFLGSCDATGAPRTGVVATRSTRYETAIVLVSGQFTTALASVPSSNCRASWVTGHAAVSFENRENSAACIDGVASDGTHREGLFSYYALPPRDFFSPSWTYDGIACHIIHLAGERATILLYFGSGQTYLLPDASPTYAKVSRSGKYIVAADSAGTMYLITTADGSIRRLPVQGSSPEISPDDRVLIYASGGHLFRADVDGTDPVQLTDDPTAMDMDPSFSPDGTAIVFIRVPQGQPGNGPTSTRLSTLTLASGRITTLRSDAYYRYPDWE